MNTSLLSVSKIKDIYLRPFCDSDYLSAYINWTSDVKTAQNLSWEPHKSRTETKTLFQLWMSEYETSQNYRWCISKENSSIGCIEARLHEPASCEVSYCLGSRFWSQGIMTATLERVLEFLKSEGLQYVYALCLQDNHRSLKVLENNYFVKNGLVVRQGENFLLLERTI